MNHTVSTVQQHRRLLHGHQPRTTFVLSPPKPISGCRGYTEPLSLGEALQVDFNEGKYMHQYAGLRRYHEVAAWAAAANGASFIDTFSLGARRPDATMGAAVYRAYQLDANRTLRRAFPPTKRFLTERDIKSVASSDDCVHFCLPG